MLNLSQLLRVPHVDPLFDISHDNSKVAFAWNMTGEWQIFEMVLGGSGQAEPLTFGPGGKFNPRYSPEGTNLAYVLDMDGSENYHLIIYDSTIDKHIDLTPNIRYALQPNFSWSPDGRNLAILSDKEGHFSTYVISSVGGEARLVLDTDFPAWQVEWSPTGNHLAVSCEKHGQDYGIFIVDLNTKETTELPLNAHAPKWSPDGEELLFCSDSRGWYDIGLYDLGGKEIYWLTESRGDSKNPIVTAGKVGETLWQYHFAYTQGNGAVNWIEILGEEGGVRKVQIGQGIHNGIKFTSDSKRMLMTFSSPRQPPDLWMTDLESGETLKLTDSFPQELSGARFVAPEEIVYEGMDGIRIPALLFRSSRKPAPAIVIIHGGPNWHFAMEWNPFMAHLASLGYVLLCPNYRGSTGYGRAWQHAAQFDMGGVDTRDVAAGARYLMREGLADKVAVTGRSHGGYLTMTCLTHFPGLWCAGSAVVPFTNWFKSHEDSRQDLQHWNIENMGDPRENYMRWYNASPYFFLDKITAPIQLICGGNDPRCPSGDSIETRDKLLELGKQVDFLLYEDEGHSFLKIENVIDSETKRLEFLTRALEGKIPGEPWNH